MCFFLYPPLETFKILHTYELRLGCDQFLKLDTYILRSNYIVILQRHFTALLIAKYHLNNICTRQALS